MIDNERLVNSGERQNCEIDMRADIGSRIFAPFNYLLVIVFCILIVGCASTEHPVPVVDRGLNDTFRSNEGSSVKKDDSYIVQRGDTLYSIAVNHGVSLSELVEWNYINDPSAIEPGQQLSLSAPLTIKKSQPSVFPLGSSAVPSDTVPRITDSGVVVTLDDQIKREPKGLKLPYSGQTLAEMQYMTNMPTTVPTVNTPRPSTANKAARIEVAPVVKSTQSLPQNNNNIEWIWPSTGKLIEGFSKDSKGVKISGESGQPVLASAAGEVVYSGNGLRGYGKLIIIKHNNTFLSAYAYNSLLLVKEGDRVAKGQKIAEMGNTDTDTVKLHFEIREQGKPVDPLKYLPSRSG